MAAVAAGQYKYITMDLRPAKHDIKTWRNDTLAINYELSIDGQPIDLSGATVRMQVRPDYGSNTLSLAFTEGDGITVTGTSHNMIEIKKLVTIASGQYVYDLEVQYSNGDVKTYVKGNFIIQEDSTK